MKRKAVIAMSGGVDSSVAAYLVKQAGFDCVGITMKLFDGADNRCCSLSDVNDARNVAYRLDIPYYVLNFTGEFEDQVIRKFIETYKQGATPNPCIDCNRYLKFERLLLRAFQIEADYVATGHYARVEKSGERFLLKKALDTRKDQSYVLYTLTQDQLAHTLFSLGTLTKEETRDLARAQGFVNAKKQDSQDLCFVPDGDYAAFIERYTGVQAMPGNIIDESGAVLGQHRGLIRYTIGQRRGLNLSFGEPRYVAAKSVTDNTLVLAREASLYTKTLIASDLNLIAYEKLDKPLRVRVKTRYLQAEQDALLEQIDDNHIRVEFDVPQRAITAGQAAVCYDGDTVICGGVIVSSYGTDME
ncbi:MAG: tRNA 2-thiouridine(34) synthase MnmA [Treponema sp.]|jgi:tRNA-specific 2-thiouridylase|nr:tRNA 2-thiouridine(34) synthase MnmA [Treponema sp.]